MSSFDFAQPFASEQERNDEHATLKALASHLANLESMAADPARTRSAQDLDAFPPVAGEEGLSPPERLARWASGHADDLAEIRRLAASSTLTDADLRRGLALAEGAFAAMLGISVEEMARRLRTEAGEALRTPTSRGPSSAGQPLATDLADRRAGAPLIVRPRPDEVFRRVRDKGAQKSWLERRIDPSDSWWDKGGLLFDDRGPALMDADGARHPFPEAARGGCLVRATVTLAAGGGGRPIHNLLFFVAGSPQEGQRVLLRLPNEGFGEEEVAKADLDEFARSAGLTYIQRHYGTSSSSQERDFPGFSSAPSLEWAIHDQATRDRSLSSTLHRMGERLGHPFENRDGG